MSKNRVRVITLLNEYEQRVTLPTNTTVLLFREGGFIPEMHVLMKSDQENHETYVIRMLTAYHEPFEMSDFTYQGHYIRNQDGLIIYCFYRKEPYYERAISDEISD
jgi:hypothetical protein